LLLDCDLDVAVAVAVAVVAAAGFVAGFVVVSWWSQGLALASASSCTGSRTRCKGTTTKSN